MDTQTKQRLTGAAILVVLAVLVIPELFTGARSPSATRVATSASEIDSESEEAAMRSVDLDLIRSEVQQPAVPAGTAVSAEPESAYPPPAPQAAPMLPPTAPTTRAAPASDAPAARPEMVPDAAPRPQAEPGSAARAAERPRDAADSARSTERAAAEPAPRARRGYAVQLGSFAARDAADRLAARVTAAGFKTSISDFTASGGRRLHRVRVGPVADRRAAEALAARLRAAGHRGTVVTEP